MTQASATKPHGADRHRLWGPDRAKKVSKINLNRALLGGGQQDIQIMLDLLGSMPRHQRHPALINAKGIAKRVISQHVCAIEAIAGALKGTPIFKSHAIEPLIAPYPALKSPPINYQFLSKRALRRHLQGFPFSCRDAILKVGA